MAKKKIFSTIVRHKQPNVVKIDLFEIERRIRKPSLPGTKLHKSKKVYSRKRKHPKNEEG